MLDDLAEGELAYWYAFAGIEPFGDEWRQTGALASAAANFAWGAKKWLCPEDFMPIVREPQSPEQLARLVEACFVSMASAQGLPIIDNRPKPPVASHR
ncbi:MAG TPA: hypothetical protein VG713_18960 [Pirellulales bacterium]|nr:hypothetical protein [Pirellulales bacterium]